MLLRRWQSRRSPEAFWKWFARNATRYHSADLGVRPDLLLRLALKLSRYRSGIVFQISRTGLDGIRDLEISADGIVALIPYVRAMVAAAPHLHGWRVHAFRQPIREEPTILIGDLRLDWSSLRFGSRRDGDVYNVDLFVPGLTPKTEGPLMRATFVLLDALIGEEAVMLKLGEIVPYPLALAPPHHRPLIDLRELTSAS